MQEFQVNVSNYSAEYGRSAGGVINSVTKSGTNGLHGEMYFYDRDNNWGAFNPYATITLQDSPGVFNPHPIKPTDWRKMAGINVGGPIIKDKLFFSFTYDWYHRNFPGTSVASSPKAFFAAPTAATISTLASRVFGASNAATQAQATTLYNNDLAALLTTSGVTPRFGEQTIWFPKLDWQINQKNHASIEVDRQRWASPTGIQTQVTNTLGIASFGNDYVKVTTGVAKLDTVFTSNIANELRVSYGRDFEFENPQTPTTPLEAANLLKSPLFPAYTDPFPFPPELTISNGWSLGTASFLTRAKFPSEYRQQYADTMTWAHGKHTFKFGEDFTHVMDDTANLRFQFGSFAETSLLNLFSDVNKANSCSLAINGKATPVPCYSSFNQAFGPLGFKLSTNEYAFFGQDDWRVLPRLTLSLGLRWDYEQLPKIILPNPAVPQTSKMPSDKNNFAPRLGFAWDIFGNGKTSLRGGYGIFYARIINSTIYNALTNTGVTGAQFQYTINTNSPTTALCAPPFPQVLSAAPNCPGAAAVVFFDHHFQNPQVHQADLTFEHDLGWNTVVSLSYLGSFGRELPDFTDVNISPATKTITYKVCGVNNESPGPCATGPQPGQPLLGGTLTVPLFTTRPNPAFGALTDVFSGTTSNYSALAFQLNHRFSQHVQFGTNVTWSHAIDYDQNNTTFTSTNALLEPDNIKQEKGNSNQNVPLRFVFHAVAESPWHVSNHILGFFANNWQMSPLYQWQNGLPYSARTSGSAPGGLSGGINGSNGDFRLYGTRNQYRQPNTSVLDLRLSKLIRYKERYSLELSGEAFNLFNHQNVTGVQTTGYFVGNCTATSIPACAGGYLGPTLTFNSGAFGTVNNANSNFAYSQRQIQLGVRIKF